MTDKTETAPAKSIIDPKYRDGRYKQRDWLGEQIASVSDQTKEVSKQVKEGDETKTVKTTVSAGVDVDAIFVLARENGLNVDKYEDQREGHGFPGRFRMTVRNMLQKVAKQRHGIVIAGKFTKAPADWLEAKGAPEAPTHTEGGEKIAKPKPAKEETPKGEDAPKAAKPAPAKAAPKK